MILLENHFSDKIIIAVVEKQLDENWIFKSVSRIVCINYDLGSILTLSRGSLFL